MLVVFSRLSSNATLSSSLNVSGLTTLSNNTTLSSSLNVSGFTTLSNNTTVYGTLNISGYSTLVNNTTLSSSLNVSGLTTLSNNTTLASLNISGRTVIGSDNYNYSDSLFEVSKNFSIRKNVINTGDRIEFKCGTGTRASYLQMEEGYDINFTAPIGNISLNSLIQQEILFL